MSAGWLRRVSAALVVSLIAVLTASITPSAALTAPQAPTVRLPGFATAVPAGAIDGDLQALLTAAGPGGQASAFVHLQPDVDYSAGVNAVRDAGLEVGAHLPAANVIYAHGLAGSLVVIARSPLVEHLEAPESVRLSMETAAWATKARQLYDSTGGLDLRVDNDNNPANGYIDGTGVGIAIVDSGVDGTHPDLTWCGGPGANQTTCPLKKNFKVTCPGVVNVGTGQCFGEIGFNEVPNSDTTSGHGTHVASISAGSGAASDSDGSLATTEDRMFRGVAPGAKLYGFGTGEGLSVVIAFAAASFQWIYDHGLQQNPPIRVVNNSYGGAGAANPDNTMTKLARALINDRNITVVWAAGNDGGNGSTLNTSVNGNDLTPGNLMIANYDDGGTGNRNNALATGSSRGLATDPRTWPDLAAPGSSIKAACAPNTVLCPTGVPLEYGGRYTSFGGTSMAAPHVTGIVAQMYQGEPTILPSAVESILESTAHKFTAGAAYQSDPQHPGGTSSFDKGHGLADARTAVLAAMGLPASTGLGGSGSKSTVITTDASDHDVDALDLTNVTFTEEANGTDVTVAFTVRGTSAAVPGVGYSYRLNASTGGVSRSLNVLWSGGATATCSATGVACTASRVGNTFKFHTTMTALGISRGTDIFDMWAASYGALIADRAPGGTGGTFLVLPARGQEHVVVGSALLNNPPIANPDAKSTPKNTAVVVDVLANDSDPDGDAISVVSASAPTNGGSVVVNANGTITYTPATEFVGTDGFTYTITDNGTPAAQATGPVTITVTDPGGGGGGGGAACTAPGILLGTDAQLDALTAQTELQTLHGAGLLVGDFLEFTMKIEDLSEIPPTTRYRTNFTHGGRSFFVAMDNWDLLDPSLIRFRYGIVEGSLVTDQGAADGGSYDADGTIRVRVAASKVGSPVAGTKLTAVGAVTEVRAGVLLVRDDAMTGDDFTLADCTSTGNEAPEAVDDQVTLDEDTLVDIDALANDSDPDGDAISLVSITQPGFGSAAVNPDGTIRYVPQANYNGQDSFTYTITDGEADHDVTATVWLTVDPVNDPPVANDDSGETGPNQAITIAVLANDTDIDGDALTVAVSGGPEWGTATVNGDNTITYQPAPLFSGTDTFTYVASDGNGGSDEATVTITVTASPDDQGSSCDAHSKGFWKQQATQSNAAKFTAAEYNTLASRAAQRSKGLFKKGTDVTTALLQTGNSVRPHAERQVAALLLSFAAHDLSGSMSYTTGLSPDAGLDPSVYPDSATYGTTAGSAANWAIDAVKTGQNLGQANEVTDSINNSQCLVC
ncbi:MAG: Ig-like domain-containing protein [Acidimicrobiales bacterium]